ncbi:hypothetical protein BAUCODRAFT_175725 [Baudoinia panamericana UAMH 10762]|uniref:Uncharacterized protein n=1 Tax=Baudoinia panamericana (strain UAMH 10762) TaxID=717646 RepID=M2M0R7_BAUPA|nr:uncharacterized protein BAUCODRAFT_175725 [Baudoinia panamericana UAMH 10762]EMD00608.1 hypothetical protein BAUCODRAFT_175725 [Baudoinia panamericana UAMH 10762]
MRLDLIALLATVGATIVHAVPVGYQQAQQVVIVGEAYVVQLQAYVLQWNTPAAQLQFNKIQSQLTNMGMYLGEITDATCIDTPEYGTDKGVTAISTQADVVSMLTQMQVDLIELSAGIVKLDIELAVLSWQSAQNDLYSCYSYIFSSSSTA